ncbi:hypothetical protein FY557_18595 [Chryseobacterium sp. SN22]|uniref:hypothetical protein n=1 Tax=Chryseobacterium sp. SN22 TaxID=2606431 RepID=UPI0011EBB80C|nr:hypothetical protein [Chryseobacterium sp. SN22]KAA0126182.1 hypothetical protein FY557_18595 [Chryseobacterium sp. SN22]
METYENVFEFLTDPTKETFLKCREFVINDPAYDPYSEDTGNVQDLLNGGKFKEVISYVNVNVLLSPSVHIFKYFAHRELGDERAMHIEMSIAQTLFECIEKTGDGTRSLPYIVTRISDERDLIRYHFNKEDTMQRLIKTEDQILDILSLTDGSEVCFDISVPYRRIAFSFSKRNTEKEKAEQKVEKPTKKNWWNFLSKN